MLIHENIVVLEQKKNKEQSKHQPYDIIANLWGDAYASSSYPPSFWSGCTFWPAVSFDFRWAAIKIKTWPIHGWKFDSDSDIDSLTRAHTQNQRLKSVLVTKSFNFLSELGSSANFHLPQESKPKRIQYVTKIGHKIQDSSITSISCITSEGRNAKFEIIRK